MQMDDNYGSTPLRLLTMNTHDSLYFSSTLEGQYINAIIMSDNTGILLAAGVLQFENDNGDKS